MNRYSSANTTRLHNKLSTFDFERNTMTEPFKSTTPIKINVGQTINNENTGIVYHTLRYHFKPASLKKKLSGEVDITIDANADQHKVDLTLGSSTFTGAYEIKAKKDKQTHECALIYNKETNSFTIERIYGVFGGLKKKMEDSQVNRTNHTSPTSGPVITSSNSPPSNQATSHSPPQPINTALPAPIHNLYEDNGHSLSITPTTKKRKIDRNTAFPVPPQQMQNVPVPSPGGPVSLTGEKISTIVDESSGDESSSDDSSGSSSDDSSSDESSDSESE
jgi:lipopolysaccharide export system protein LptA